MRAERDSKMERTESGRRDMRRIKGDVWHISESTTDNHGTAKKNII